MILGPRTGDLDDDGVLAAYPWPDEGPWVRAMMVTTLDGAAAGPDGLSGSISSDADRAVFDAVRRHADAVLVGAGTVKAEKYAPMTAKDADAQARADQGQRPAPTLTIVSGSLDLNWDDAVFTESTERPIVFTGSRSSAADRTRAQVHCDLVMGEQEHVAATEVVDELVRRGLRRIVCEGGPTLLEDVVRSGLLDEADITLSPMITSTAETPRGKGLDEVARFELRHVLTRDGFLMNRYVRPDA